MVDYVKKKFWVWYRGAGGGPGPGGARPVGQGRGPAGGGAPKFSRGGGPAGAGAFKVSRGGGPAGAGAFKVSRGEGPRRGKPRAPEDPDKSFSAKLHIKGPKCSAALWAGWSVVECAAGSLMVVGGGVF